MENNDVLPTFKLQQIVTRQPIKLPSLRPVEPPIRYAQGIQIDPKGQGVLLSSFVCGIFGCPGAGKSTLIEHLLLDKEIFSQKFDRVLFVGPTIYPNLIQDSYNHSKTVNIDWIQQKIRDCAQWKCSNMLIVMDDIVSQIKGNNSPKFIDLFYNRRHCLPQGTVNIIVTSQKWNMIPPFIRTVFNMIISFPLAKQQQTIMCNEVSLKVDKKTLMGLFAELTRHQREKNLQLEMVATLIVYNELNGITLFASSSLRKAQAGAFGTHKASIGNPQYSQWCRSKAHYRQYVDQLIL